MLEQNLRDPFKVRRTNENIAFLKKLSEAGEGSSSKLNEDIQTIKAALREAGFNDEEQYDQYITLHTLYIVDSNDIIRVNLISVCAFLNQLEFSLEQSFRFLTGQINGLSQEQFNLLLETENHLMHYIQADERQEAFQNLLSRIGNGTYANNPNRVPSSKRLKP